MLSSIGRLRIPGASAAGVNRNPSGPPPRSCPVEGTASLEFLQRGAVPTYRIPVACIFCRAQSKLSKEHLWPDWARRTFSEAELKAPILHSIHGSDGPPQEIWDASTFSSTLKKVCQPCNNGWMSRLEDEARPHAKPLLMGEPRILDTQAQQALALWGYLKCVLLLSIDDTFARAMPNFYGTLYALRDQRLLPPHISVFTARHTGPRRGQYQHRLLGKDPDRPDLLVQTFTIRQLTVQVVRNYTGHFPVTLERDPRIAGAERLIWPSGDPFRWPPGPGLDDGGLTIYTGPQPGRDD